MLVVVGAVAAVDACCYNCGHRVDSAGGMSGDPRSGGYIAVFTQAEG